MNNTYEEFIKHIYYEHIEKRLAPWKRRHWHHLDDLGYEITGLTRSLRAIRFLQDYAESDEGLGGVFTPETLKNVVERVKYGVQNNNRIVVDTGVADVLQDYLKEIVEGMTAEHFPQADLDALRESGSSDARREIVAMVYLMKSRKEDWIRFRNDYRFSRRLEQAREEVERVAATLPKELPNAEEQRNDRPVTVKRAVFKGIGSIGQGALLTLTDVSLLAGMWGTSISAEQTTVGAVISITSGIEMILTGVGELRGE